MLSLHCSQPQNPQLIEFSTLNINCQSLNIIDIIPTPYIFVSRLYINHNNLLSLHGIEQFRNLQQFHFNYNWIWSWKELERIKNPFFMKSIAYIGNPIQGRQNLNNLSLNNVEYSTIFHSELICSNKNVNSLNHRQQVVKKLFPYLREWNNLRSVRQIPKINVRTLTATTQTLSSKSIQPTKTPNISLNQKIKPRPTQISTFQQTQGYTQSYGINGSFNDYSILNQIQIQPFRLDGQPKTARFSAQNQSHPFAMKFIQQQRQALVSCFYFRTLLQKSLKSWKMLTKQMKKSSQFDYERNQSDQNDINIIRQAWIQIRMFAAVKKIRDQYKPKFNNTI